MGAFLRISDAADAGRGRTPVVLLERWGEHIPEVSRAHWLAHGLVVGSTLDPVTRQVVFHLDRSADPRDHNLRDLYIATTEDLESTRSVLMVASLAPPIVCYEQHGQYLLPALVYAKESGA